VIDLARQGFPSCALAVTHGQDGEDETHQYIAIDVEVGEMSTEGDPFMSEEPGLLQAILASPDDPAHRLIYADWLEDHGDPRGDYLRMELALASARPQSRKARALRASLQELRGRIEPAWLAVIDQPALMRANPTPFPAGWWSIDLEGYREGAETYGLFSYEALPPLPVDVLQGDFRWLKGKRARAAANAKPGKKVQHLADAAAGLGLTLPPEFAVLMESSVLKKRVRSCTDCFFNWPRRIVESPGGEGGYLVRFYSDSQGCLHWYLYLTQRGYHCVVVSGGFYGGYHELKTDEDMCDEPSDQFWFCAPSFEAFVYRIWIENEIWYALSDDYDPLTAEEQAYVNHYMPA
jgi:uncharacterized protein (TIGR02996 family)